MQNLFAEDTDWHTPWMSRVLPKVERIARAPSGANDLHPLRPGAARRRRRRHLAPLLRAMGVDDARPARRPRWSSCMPALARLVPPAEIVDKTRLLALDRRRPRPRLQARGIDTLIVTGGETDVCVLGAVLGAVDRGYRIVWSPTRSAASSDETHDALADALPQPLRPAGRDGRRPTSCSAGLGIGLSSRPRLAPEVAGGWPEIDRFALPWTEPGLAASNLLFGGWPKRGKSWRSRFYGAALQHLHTFGADRPAARRG